MSGFGSGLKNSARVTWAARNTSGRSLIPLSTRSTSLMTGSYSISTSRMMPKRSPVRKCWVRVPWTMLHHIPRPFSLGIFCCDRTRTETSKGRVSPCGWYPAFCFAESSSLCANLVVTLYDALGQSLCTCVPGERVHLWQGVTH